MATIQINIGCTKGGADEQQDEGEKCQCGSRCTGTPGCFGSCGGEERSRGRVGMGSKPAEVANMPITTERSNTYDTTHVMIATPTAGEHAARPPRTTAHRPLSTPAGIAGQDGRGSDRYRDVRCRSSVRDVQRHVRDSVPAWLAGGGGGEW